MATQNILGVDVTESPRKPETFNLLASLDSGMSDDNFTYYAFTDRACGYSVRLDRATGSCRLSGTAIRDASLERTTVTVPSLEEAVRYVLTRNLWVNEWGDSWLLYPFAPSTN